MQKRILLADDDQGIRQALARVLESEHYEIITAKTGRQAAEVCLIYPLDLVLLDLNMPDKDGWEAFCLIKTIRPRLPVFVLTARPNQLEKAVEMGVNALMEKPLDFHQLLKTIREVIEKSTEGGVTASGTKPERFYYQPSPTEKD
ncbi:MAG: heme response regulator HssR [Verrucomicrobiales bacterium]|jgi:DNA-binding response OmpR family regulator|nr:heme response regulator HssR [Verrucomicrobiales bacterium]